MTQNVRKIGIIVLLLTGLALVLTGCQVSNSRVEKTVSYHFESRNNTDKHEIEVTTALKATFTTHAKLDGGKMLIAVLDPAGEARIITEGTAIDYKEDLDLTPGKWQIVVEHHNALNGSVEISLRN